MKYTTDDGKKTFDTAEECAAFERQKKVEALVLNVARRHLDQLTVEVTSKVDGEKIDRELTQKEYARRYNVLEKFLLWDIEENPGRWLSEEEPEDVTPPLHAVTDV